MSLSSIISSIVMSLSSIISSIAMAVYFAVMSLSAIISSILMSLSSTVSSIAMPVYFSQVEAKELAFIIPIMCLCTVLWFSLGKRWHVTFFHNELPFICMVLWGVWTLAVILTLQRKITMLEFLSPGWLISIGGILYTSFASKMLQQREALLKAFHPFTEDSFTLLMAVRYLTVVATAQGDADFDLQVQLHSQAFAACLLFHYARFLSSLRAKSRESMPESLRNLMRDHVAKTLVCLASWGTPFRFLLTHHEQDALCDFFNMLTPTPETSSTFLQMLTSDTLQGPAALSKDRVMEYMTRFSTDFVIRDQGSKRLTMLERSLTKLCKTLGVSTVEDYTTFCKV